MKKTLKLQIIIICLCSTSLLAGPKLEISEQRFDFGAIPANSIVYKHFWFKSTGTDTLIINNIKTGCACALMETVKDTLPPGDSVKVGIEWKIGNKIFSVGRYPYIFTNASSDPYRIYLTGEAYKTLDKLQPVSLVPYKFELSKYKDDSVDEMKFTLTNHSDRSVQFKIVTELPKECEIKLPESIEPGSKGVGTVKVKKEYLDSEFTTSVTIVSVDNPDTKITIPIRRKIFSK
ncbi:MAG: DUF1573 domain-containing protein [Calditrichaeota bacterium]|nr:MAG: DUF1573 domain-containing protein [Calditrichota bacterium]